MTLSPCHTKASGLKGQKEGGGGGVGLGAGAREHREGGHERLAAVEAVLELLDERLERTPDHPVGSIPVVAPVGSIPRRS